MTMLRVFVASLVLCGTLRPSGSASVQTSGNHLVTIHLNQTVDPSRLTISTMFDTPSGGRYSSDDMPPRLSSHVTMPTPRDIVINSPADAQALHVVIYAQGYRFVFVDLPSLAAESQTISTTLVPLPTLTLRGTVTLPYGIGPDGFALDVRHDATVIIMNYFDHGRSRGFVGFFGVLRLIGTTTVAADASFSIDVPDFAQDPNLAAQSLGWFQFTAHITPNYRYQLAPAGSSFLRGLRVASSYPEPIRLLPG
jgi:hypothetical protein